MSYAVGDRVKGRFTDNSGTVVEVVSAGVRVHWDVDQAPDPVVYHATLHVVPATVAGLQKSIQKLVGEIGETKAELEALQVEHRRLEIELAVLEAGRKAREVVKAEDALAEYKRQQLEECERNGRRGP